MCSITYVCCKEDFVMCALSPITLEEKLLNMFCRLETQIVIKHYIEGIIVIKHTYSQ